MFEIMEQNISTKQNIKLSTANTSEENIILYSLCFSIQLRAVPYACMVINQRESLMLANITQGYDRVRRIMWLEKLVLIFNVGRYCPRVIWGKTINMVRKPSANI